MRYKHQTFCTHVSLSTFIYIQDSNPKFQITMPPATPTWSACLHVPVYVPRTFLGDEMVSAGWVDAHATGK